MRQVVGMTNSNVGAQPPLIAHIIYALGTGGLENGLVNIINRCPEDRYRHAIICLTGAESFASRLSSPHVSVIELHKNPGHDFAMYWHLWWILRQLRPAVVHTRNLAALETQVLGLFMPRCRRVHGEHGRDVNDLDGSNFKYRWLRRALRPIIHRFIAVSGDLAGWLVETVKVPATQVTQIYNGVDHARFTSRFADEGTRPGLANSMDPRSPPGCPTGFIHQGCRVIGTIGRLATVKDQQLLICALAHILEAQPEQRSRLRCIIVGDGPERAALENCIVEHGLDECIWLAGDREDIPTLLACMDVFVLPSLGEGISNTVLEAMATGLPVIATAVGGNPELIQDGVTGHLVPVGDVSALAHAIISLVDDPGQCGRMGRAAVQRVQSDFNWERTVAAYLQVYDEVLQHPQVQGHTDRT